MSDALPPQPQPMANPAATAVDVIRSAVEQESRQWNEVADFLRGLCRKHYENDIRKIQGDIDIGFVVNVNKNMIYQIDFRVFDSKSGKAHEERRFCTYFPDKVDPECTIYGDLEDATKAFCVELAKRYERVIAYHRQNFFHKYLEIFGVSGTLALASLVLASFLALFGVAPGELWSLCVAAFAFYFGTTVPDRKSRRDPTDAR